MSHSFISDTLRVAKSKGVIIACGLASSAITARYLGPSGSGAYAALLVIPTLLMSFGSLGIRQSSTFLLGKKHIDEVSIRYAIINVWVFTSLFGVVGSYLMTATVSSFHGKLETALAVAAIPFSLYTTYISGIYLGKNNIRDFNKIDWVPALVVLASNIVLLVWLGMGLTGALIAHLLGPIVIFLLVVYRNPVSLKDYRLDLSVIKSLLSLGAIYAVSMLVINLNYRLDLILLDRLSTASELGIYTKGAGITQYLWQIPMLLSTIVFARSAVASDGQTYSRKVARLLRMSLVVIGLGSLGLYLAADVVVSVLFGSEFTRSADTIRILLPGVLIMTLFKVMNMDLAGKGKPWIAMLAMLPALLVNVVANLALIPRLGANGSAWASTISYSLAGTIFIVLYSRVVRVPLIEIFSFSREDFTVLFNKIRRL